MNLLLDTCVLLWWLDGPVTLLSKEASTAGHFTVLVAQTL